MSKKTCFIIFVIALATILVSYVFNFIPVTKQVNAVFSQMQNVYIALSAVILSLLLRKIKYFWLIMLGLAVVTAIVVQTVILSASLSAFALIYKAFAFIVYVYLVVLSCFML